MNEDTRKERRLRLNLADDDLRNFLDKVYADGTTPAEVLEGFINDLVAGDYSHGSDERDLAKSYYNRCGYAFNYSPVRFFQWLLDDFRLDEVADALEDREEDTKELEYSKAHPEEFEDAEDLEAHIQDFRNAYKEDNEIVEKAFQEYTRRTKNPEPREEAEKGVIEYREKMKRIEEGGAI